MARYISHHAGYSISITDPIEEPDPHHPRRNIVTKDGITAWFVHGDTTEYEREQAKKVFKFNGLPLEEDAMTPVDPFYRFSAYDTGNQGFDEKTKKHVEDTLDKALYNGTDFIRIDTPKRPPPWSGYDKLRSPAKILSIAESTDTDLEYILAYEQENLNRSEVIDAINAKLTPKEDEVLVEA